MILAVRRDVLFDRNKDYFQGFREAGTVDYKERILKIGNTVWMRRSEAEKNPNFKHPISYLMIVNPSKKQVFTFQRAKKGDYDEARLQEKWSWGVGGHVEASDSLIGDDVLQAAFSRELKEEVIFEGETQGRKIKNLGYINDDGNDVGKVHFGLLYVVETDATSVRPNPDNHGIAKGRLMRLAELEIMCRNPKRFQVENWSRIALEPLKKYLK